MSKDGFISREELAAECGFSAKTLKRKMAKKKITIPSGYISPEDQALVLKTIGKPRKRAYRKKKTTN